MEKTNGYYVGKYLKNNALVLICELIVVLLLSMICTIIMDGKPAWLAPTVAGVTYLIAELRFMMAYVATNARYEHEMEMAKGERQAAEAEPQQEMTDDTALAATVLAAEPDAQPEQEDDEPTVDERTYDEQPVEQLDGAAADEALSDEESDMAEPTLDDAVDVPVVASGIEDEAQDVSAADEPEMVLESLELALDDTDDVTMDADDFARDVVEIGEITGTEQENESEQDFTF